MGLFANKKLIDEDAAQWLFSAFQWCMDHFEPRVFYRETVLVQPTNDYFPGRADSAPAMAGLIFDKVKVYAGMGHWPFRLLDPGTPTPEEPPTPQDRGLRRGSQDTTIDTASNDTKLIIPYNPHQLGKPEAIIADFAYLLAHYLGMSIRQSPPGGENYRPHATEVLAVYMGFGIMFANTAYTFRGGCGSCYNPLAERSAFLSQDEVTFALALFATLKDIPANQVRFQLKSYLRPVYKKAVKQIQQHEEKLQTLKNYQWAELKEVQA